jgi:hypothetical protein
MIDVGCEENSVQASYSACDAAIHVAPDARTALTNAGKANSKFSPSQPQQDGESEVIYFLSVIGHCPFEHRGIKRSFQSSLVQHNENAFHDTHTSSNLESHQQTFNGFTWVEVGV